MVAKLPHRWRSTLSSNTHTQAMAQTWAARKARHVLNEGVLQTMYWNDTYNSKSLYDF